MQSVIEALFDGKALPDTRKHTPSAEEARAIGEWQALVDAWDSAHSREERLQLDRIISAHNYVGYYADRSSFAYGFQLAANLLLEVFAAKETLLQTDNADS